MCMVGCPPHPLTHRLHTEVPERAGLNGQRSLFHGLGDSLKLFIDDPVEEWREEAV